MAETEESPKRISTKILYREVIKTEDYKEKVKDKKNVIFIVAKTEAELEKLLFRLNLSQKQLQDKNIWFVITGEKPIWSRELKETNQLIIYDGKIERL